MSRESAYYDDQAKGGGMGAKLADIATIAGGAGVAATPVGVAYMANKKDAEKKQRQTDAEMKRESRSIPKPANFDAMQESIQEARDAADRKKISDMGYAKGGKVSSASKRADGCAIRGKTRA